MENIFTTAKRMIEREYKYHHSALKIGYQKTRTYKILTYKGKYGQGKTIEYPTNESNCSNWFHKIEYYIKNEKTL